MDKECLNSETPNHKSDYIPLKFGNVFPNLWNVQNSDGNLAICNVDGYVSFKINLLNANYLNRSIAGYPGIGYGVSGWNYEYKKQSSKIKFPLKVKKLLLKKIYVKSVSKIVDYEPNDLQHNITYDLWIKKKVEGAPGRNDVEIMIQVFNKKLLPTGKLFYKDVLIPIGKKGSARRWNIFVGRSITGAFTVSFLINEKFDLNENIINLNDFINIFIKYFPDHNIDNYYIMGIEYGMEFGNSDLKNSKISFNINKMEIKRGIFNVKII